MKRDMVDGRGRGGGRPLGLVSGSRRSSGSHGG